MKHFRHICMSLLLCCGTFASMAQEVKVKVDNSRPYGACTGLYNERTQRWVVAAIYKYADYIGQYGNQHYYAVQTQDGLFGFICSSDFSRFLVNPRYVSYEGNQFTFGRPVPFVGVCEKSDWGVLNLETLRYVYGGLKWQRVNVYGEWMRLVDWEGKQYEPKTADLKKVFDADLAAAAAEKERQRLAELERQEQQRLAQEREKKQQELASFTLFAKNYITPKMDAWQEKGEFEKVADYQRRVTGSQRQQKIEDLSLEAERLFIDEHIKLSPLAGLTLEQYDSENEVFSVRSPRFGQLLLPVPIAEGPAFKQAFAGIQPTNVTYFIEDDKLALRSAEWIHDGHRYLYHAQNALNYDQYVLNPDKLDLKPLNVSTGKNDQQMARIVVTVLSPSPEIVSNYEQPEVTFRVDIKPGAGQHPVLYAEINGGDRIALTPNAESTKKGAKVVSGNSYTLTLPTREVGRECNVAFFAQDEQNMTSETQKCRLKYTGMAAKPVLHVLAVGVGDYQSSDLSRLRYPKQDAQDFVQAIRHADLSDYQSLAEPIVLLDNAATRSAIESHVSAIRQQANQGDVVMAFFSGHGVREGEDAYFMAVDSRAEEPYTGVDFNFLAKQLQRLVDKQVRVILFMDACHSGSMIGRKGTRSMTALEQSSVIGFYSSTASEESSETAELGNGYFTRALVDGLNGAAAENGEITLSSLQNYIVKEVKQRSGGKQNPVNQNLEGDAKLFNVKKGK